MLLTVLFARHPISICRLPFTDELKTHYGNVGVIEVENTIEALYRVQEGIWKQPAELKKLLQKAKVSVLHTTISFGDVLQMEDGKAYFTVPGGFMEVKERSETEEKSIAMRDVYGVMFETAARTGSKSKAVEKLIKLQKHVGAKVFDNAEQIRMLHKAEQADAEAKKA
jgi:uncharacterized protein (UPF0335 family)